MNNNYINDSNNWVSLPLAEISTEYAKDIERIGAVIDNQTTKIRPGAIAIVAGQPFVIVRQITRREFEIRVVASGVDLDWLNAPVDSLFWEVSTD